MLKSSDSSDLGIVKTDKGCKHDGVRVDSRTNVMLISHNKEFARGKQLFISAGPGGGRESKVAFARDRFLPKNRTVDSVFKEAGIDSSNSGGTSRGVSC